MEISPYEMVQLTFPWRKESLCLGNGLSRRELRKLRRKFGCSKTKSAWLNSVIASVKEEEGEGNAN